MPLDATPEERARALSVVHHRMLEGLWVKALAGYAEPVAEADAIRNEMLRELEHLLSHVAGRDASVTQHLAIDFMEEMWRVIRRTLASHDEPIPYAPVEGPDKPAGTPPAGQPPEPGDEVLD